MTKVNKRRTVIFIILTLALLAAGLGWYLSHKDKDTQSLVGVVTVDAEIISFDGNPQVADAPQKMTVKMEDGTLLTTYSYCGYTRIEEAPKIDENLEVGDKVTVHGEAVTGTSEIDVCSNQYYIKKI